MSFLLGMVAGASITFVAFVAYMAPKHWDWYQQNIDLRSLLKVAVERAAHYQHLVSPIEWGPREQHESRIIHTKDVPWEGVTIEPGESVDFVFDDIKDGGE